MRSMKDQLSTHKETLSRWVKETTVDLTGEVVREEQADRMFIKVDPRELRERLKNVSVTSFKVALYILEQFDHYKNRFVGTYSEVRKALDVSPSAANNAMIELQSVDFMRKIRNGLWMLNPAVAIGIDDQSLPSLMNAYFRLPAYVKRKAADNSHILDRP